MDDEKKLREWIENILRHRLIWNSETQKFIKVIVYKNDNSVTK